MSAIAIFHQQFVELNSPRCSCPFHAPSQAAQNVGGGTDLRNRVRWQPHRSGQAVDPQTHDLDERMHRSQEHLHLSGLSIIPAVHLHTPYPAFRIS